MPPDTCIFGFASSGFHSSTSVLAKFQFLLNKSNHDWKKQDVFAPGLSIEQLWQATHHLLVLLLLSEILIVVYINEACAFFLVFSLPNQANKTGGSSQMELEGAKRAFAYLISVGLEIAVFVSDRRRGIAKWRCECQSNTAHFFDIWHVARSIGKKIWSWVNRKAVRELASGLKVSKTICRALKNWLLQNGCL